MVHAAAGRKAGPTEMRSANLALVLNLLFQQRVLSRADLSKLTGLTRATVSSLVDELISLGYVREIGTNDDGMIGKPAVQLELHPERIYAIAAFLQDDGLTVAKLNLNGRLSDVRTRPIRTMKLPNVTRLMLEMLHAAIQELEENGQRLAEIGLSLPSPLVDRKAAYSGFLKPLEDFNFYELLRREFRCPIFVENDADAGALAESWFGAANGVRRAYYLTVYHGIGSGFAYDREPYYGIHKITPEFGHTTLDPNGAACFCGRRGCLAAIASDLALCNYTLNGGTLTDDLGTDMDRLLRHTDRVIYRLAKTLPQSMPPYVWTCADRLGIGIANLTDMLCPDLIIVSGRIFEIPGFFDRVVSAARQTVHPMLSDHLHICLSQLDCDAPLVGAGAFVLRRLYTDPYLISSSGDELDTV